MIKKINICAFLEQFNREYEYLYDHHDHVAGYDEAVDSFDAFLKDILHELGIETDSSFRNSAAYIQNWHRVLKDDPKMVVHAAGKAEKAVKLILNVEQAEQNDEGHAAEQAA